MAALAHPREAFNLLLGEPLRAYQEELAKARKQAQVGGTWSCCSVLVQQTDGTRGMLRGAVVVAGAWERARRSWPRRESRPRRSPGILVLKHDEQIVCAWYALLLYGGLGLAAPRAAYRKRL